jgi:sugar transferase (PEP-CTERM/EpsH1 system associated)
MHVGALKAMCEQTAVFPWKKYPALLRGGLSLLCGGTITLGAYQSDPLRTKIAEWGKFDCVYAFSGAMAPYALGAEADRRLLDLCDADSEKWIDYARTAGALRRLVYQQEGNRLRQLETKWLDAFDAVSVITSRERQVIDARGQCNRLHVVSNGVKLVDGAPYPSRIDPVITFIGALDYPPNIDAVNWFAREIWPMIYAAVPTARFQVVGRNPVRSVRALGRINGVQIVGEVAEVRPHLLESRVIVAPLRIARGLPNKVLEAMAARRPVVTTSIVAEAIHACDGQELLIADKPGDFAARVVELLAHPRLCDDIGEAAMTFVRRNHDWELIGEQFESLLLGPQSRDRISAARILQGTSHAVL